jgi:FtsP/CotA-like multicopper oxidase with cupredoxin domain
MAEANDMKVQNTDASNAAPATREEVVRAARRRFLRQALAVTSGIALAELVPASLSQPTPQTLPPCPTSGGNFIPVGEITRNGTKLQAVMTVTNGSRAVSSKAGSTPTQLMLRYFSGYNSMNTNQKWPTSSNGGPGPTLRCEIGDTVQITLLNRVQVKDFPGTLDVAEEGRGANGCDRSTKAPDSSGQGGVENFYPANDRYPNCFHGSSSANMHFHGTHVTPSSTGDNVLVNIRPLPQMTDADAQKIIQWFQQIFQHCELGQEPKKWGQLPPDWQKYQMGDLQAGVNDPKKRGVIGVYDQNAAYVGTGANPNGRGLPPNLQLWPQNKEAIDQGIWPQWYVGSYPICFQIPRYDPTCDPNHPTPGQPCLRMGQAPGTHWYHSHKHGSTSINLFNGLAGALIIEDNTPTGYDGALKAFYTKTGNKLEDVVLVLQQITDTINLTSANPNVAAPPVLINGQVAPTIQMKQNEVRLFRMINATVSSFIKATFLPPQPGAVNVQFKRTGQDGVQLAFANYNATTNGTGPIQLSPANRVDLLVQTPAVPGCYVLQDAKAGPLLYINVSTSSASPAMKFPTTETDYPPLPRFLNDIDASTIHVRREIVYNSRKDTLPAGQRNLLQFTIDGKQFEDQIINQVMLLDSAEEWKLVNADPNTGIAHPFHIHVNPFQIVEIYDPTGFYNSGTPLHLIFDDPTKQPPGKFFVWWDTFGIPPPKVTKDDKGNITKVDPGYFRMRSRFVDFTGQYVQHCHILAHEDRGMMQLLEVVPNRTIIKHH